MSFQKLGYLFEICPPFFKKNFRFSRTWFFIHNFFDNRDAKIRMVPSCSARRKSSENVSFDLKRSISKFDLRSSQFKLRLWPKLVNMHIIRTESTSLVVGHHLRVSISILSRVIKKKSWWPWMTLPGVTDDVRIDLSMIFCISFLRGLLMKYKDVIRVPLSAIVPEIFAKNDFLTIICRNFWDILNITQKVIEISTWNFVYPKNGTISRGRVNNFW